MPSRVEWRTEKCQDCGEDFERAWLVRVKATGVTMPDGFRRAKYQPNPNTKTWVTIEAPTRDATLCLCDAP